MKCKNISPKEEQKEFLKLQNNMLTLRRQGKMIPRNMQHRFECLRKKALERRGEQDKSQVLCVTIEVRKDIGFISPHQ